MISLKSFKQALNYTLEVYAALRICTAFNGKMHYITGMSVTLCLKSFPVSILLLLLP